MAPNVILNRAGSLSSWMDETVVCYGRHCAADVNCIIFRDLKYRWVKSLYIVPMHAVEPDIEQELDSSVPSPRRQP